MAFDAVVNTFSATTDVESFVNDKTLALVSPKYTRGVSGFIFDIPQNETVELSSEITDLYTENNSYLNDHRIIKPAKITLSGLIGELVVKQDFFDLITDTLQTALTTVDAYLGDYTDGMTQKIQSVFSTSVNAISRATQIANRTKNIITGFDGTGQYSNLQQRAFTNLKALFNSKTVLTVLTPWYFFDSVLIESLTFTQGPDTELESDISITLKEIRFAEIGTFSFAQNIEAKRSDVQNQTTTDTGKVQGTRNSLLFDATTALTGGF